MTIRSTNFSAGPATLPISVMEKIQSEFLNYNNTGMSVIEMSHRWPVFEEILFSSFKMLREIAGIPDRFDILYMTGGASTQFALIPMNLSVPGKKAGYIKTGVWAKKAVEQAQIQQVPVHIAGSSEDSKYSYIPADLDIKEDLSYLHITSNNTVYGSQFHKFPDPTAGGKFPDSKLVIDMSSDFLSRPMNPSDWDHIGLIYAGLQKNAGPSGLTVVIIDKELYAREKETTPTLFRYSTYAPNDSMFNTPPTFQIYVFKLILEWLIEQGGLSAMEKHNEKKARLIYDAIDRHPDFYKGHVKKEDRSLMNITFFMENPDLEKEFVAQAKAAGMWGLKGHRIIGGIRVSLYNAMDIAGTEKLVSFMEDFYNKNSGKR
jgi:phosphoserine aminotransferase